jgi:hypothetical protein
MTPADQFPHKLCTECATAARRLPRNAGRALIWIYRHTLSPLVGYNCRHLPTCSVYRTVRTVGRRMDDAGADPALPALGNFRHRQCSIIQAAGRAMVSAVALWALARCQRLLKAQF